MTAVWRQSKWHKRYKKNLLLKNQGPLPHVGSKLFINMGQMKALRESQGSPIKNLRFKMVQFVILLQNYCVTYVSSAAK